MIVLLSIIYSLWNCSTQVGFPPFHWIFLLCLCFLATSTEPLNSAYPRAQTLECVCFPASFTTLKIWSSLLTLDTISVIGSYFRTSLTQTSPLNSSYLFNITHLNILDKNSNFTGQPRPSCIPQQISSHSHPHLHGWKFWLYSHRPPALLCHSSAAKIRTALCLKIMSRIWHFVPLLLLSLIRVTTNFFPSVAGKASLPGRLAFLLDSTLFYHGSQSEAMKNQITSLCSNALQKASCHVQEKPRALRSTYPGGPFAFLPVLSCSLLQPHWSSVWDL